MEGPAVEAHADGVLLRVKVQPKASRNAHLGEQGGRIRIALTAPPVEGAANEALIKYLAAVLAVRRQQIQIRGGEHARDKSLLVRDTTVEHVNSALGRGVP